MKIPGRLVATKANYVDHSDSDLDVSDIEAASHTASPPPRKRARGSKQPAQKKAPAKKAAYSSRGKGKQRDLSLLPTMPMDIVFEILSSLPPKDLISVSRTTKSFREMLLSRQATTIWKNALEAADAPECPDDCSEPQWAALLFELPCNNCGNRNALLIDFALRRRLCKPCKRNHLVAALMYIRDYPTVDKEMFEYLPFTNAGGRVHTRHTTKYYWTADVDGMKEKWDKYKEDIANEVSDAQDKFAAFKEERKTFIEGVMDHANMCMKWKRDSANSLVQARTERRERRSLELYNRLTGLGHEEADISASLTFNDLDKTTPITDKNWVRLGTDLENRIHQNRAVRLRRERNAVICSRMQIVDTYLLTPHLNTLPARECPYQPSLYDICEFPQLTELINAPNEAAFTAQNVLDVKDEVITSIPDWIKARKEELRSLLPSDDAHDPSVDRLSLVTSVFDCASDEGICHQRCTLISWDAVGAHHCTSIKLVPSASFSMHRTWSCKTNIVYDTKSSSAVKCFVLLAGLDPHTATSSDLDRKDMRFMCRTCTPSYYWKHGQQVYGRQVYNWYEAIDHACVSHSMGGNPVDIKDWEVLPEKDRAMVNELEAKELDRRDTFRWACSHCTGDQSESLKVYNTVAAHLRTSHNVTDPQESIDVFLYPGLKGSGHHRAPAVLAIERP
ncbi:hypothetical protein BDQ12DRAFT_738566 [Crucibulum laeve]|uniref:F-box domain-containing protein n=1 Tax=Crucibulum laeve TaxID=68775 RepID=A0A5C3LM36_9AGAR|nr:hypothetical protein BDQ12DRAFT_738566 [Crucibulum laeve]